jgi:hypothetical protein
LLFGFLIFKLFLLQMTDADPLGAFNDDLGNRVKVVYLAPGEAFPA